MLNAERYICLAKHCHKMNRIINRPQGTTKLTTEDTTHYFIKTMMIDLQ